MTILFFYILPLIFSELLSIYYFKCTNEVMNIIPIIIAIVGIIPGFNIIGFLLGLIWLLLNKDYTNYLINNKFNKFLFGIK